MPAASSGWPAAANIKHAGLAWLREYNRNVKLASVCLAALLLAACSKNIDTPEAVKEGVIKDIAKKVDVGSMDVNVDSVDFREKEADAKVSFKPKGGPASQSITMNYVLERQGDEWHIKSRDMETHGARPAAPGGALPPGHPGATSGATPDATPGAVPGGALPAGHPQVDPSQRP
jgi:hypothetical protein